MDRCVLDSSDVTAGYSACVLVQHARRSACAGCLGGICCCGSCGCFCPPARDDGGMESCTVASRRKCFLKPARAQSQKKKCCYFQLKLKRPDLLNCKRRSRTEA